MKLQRRPRRLRQSEAIRRLVCETVLTCQDLIYPMFAIEGTNKRIPIDSMPNQYRLSCDQILKECEELLKLGIGAINLFGYCDPEKKDETGTAAYAFDNLICSTVRTIKKQFPEICIQTDIALDPYTSHSQDGLVIDGKVANDETVETLCQMALAHAESGVDWVAPSDMMDGRIGAIRNALDHANYESVGILAYSVKYASSLYDPFRDALKSQPSSGDKKTYQMDVANALEALTEAKLDWKEGADVIMVKPAFLDIVQLVKTELKVPVAAYQVSGEYAMILAASQKGWIRKETVMLESLLGIKRAGADMILTYFAKEAGQLLNRST